MNNHRFVEHEDAVTFVGKRAWSDPLGNERVTIGVTAAGPAGGLADVPSPSSGHVVRDDQLRTGCCRSVAAVQAEVVGNRVVVIVQLETQADLGQAGVRGQFVDEGFCAGQVDRLAMSLLPVCKPGRYDTTVISS